uniref:Large ribosomal subunit protein uL22c n=1 Tax=Bulboplastis apyrenoidosa TaxID=1070855 RepID=A0A1X9PTN5_9RHOD|nr:50S ribosomal protein L22 [Bulboplastis apyrenoidosa]ARO90779.1 50S ribosomal protein L22 [Bulboplastis apyrenoidosa]
MNISTQEYKITGKYIRLSPSKARRVIDQIRGKTYAEALLILNFMPYKACKFIIKLLNSVVSNAKNMNNVDISTLTIKTIYVDKGPMLKRSQPRAQGRAYPIHKPTSHITIIL